MNNFNANWMFNPPNQARFRIQVPQGRRDATFPALVDLKPWNQEKYLGHKGQEGNLVRLAALVSEGKPAHRGSPGHRGRKELPGRKGQGESPGHADRQAPLVIRKIVYLHRF